MLKRFYLTESRILIIDSVMLELQALMVTGCNRSFDRVLGDFACRRNFGENVCPARDEGYLDSVKSF